MIDLHIHTNASDGQHTPADTVRIAADEGARYIAITDHDRIAGLAQAKAAAESAGIGFIPGIEISVQGNRELHILGYYIDYNDPALARECEKFIRLREQRADRIFDYLRNKGFALSEEQVQKHTSQGAIGRPHFAKAMVDAGYVSTVREAFDRFLGTPEFDKVERTKPTASEGISIILSAGGVPVLAHPSMLKLNDEEMEGLILSLKQVGLMGIECYYSMYTTEQVSKYLGYAKEFELLVTGGSDFHGESTRPGVKIGSGMSDLSVLEEDNIVESLRSGKRKVTGQSGSECSEDTAF